VEIIVSMFCFGYKGDRCWNNISSCEAKKSNSSWNQAFNIKCVCVCVCM